MRYHIYQDGERINTIVADEGFVTRYCRSHGYTWEAAPLPIPEPEPEPDPEEPGEARIWADMAAAITEGVNEV